MAADTGITCLYGHLVELFLPSDQRPCQPLRPRADRIKQRKKLFAKTYDVMLFKSRMKSQKVEELGEVNQVLSHVFNMRWQRNFDSASRLENLLMKIKDSVEEDETVRNTLKLILKLAGSVPKKREESVAMPTICHSSKASVLLPHGPITYGDSRVSYTDSRFYTMYSRESFKPNLPSLEIPDFNMNILKSLPGSGVSKFFSNEADDSRKKTHNSRTLFGALVDSKANAVDPWTKLDLPSIDDKSSLQIRIPCMSPVLTDEGLQTANESSESTLTDSSEVDIWAEALTLPPTRRKQAWDSTQKPYLTECGAEALNQVYWYNQDLVAMVDPTYLPVRQLYVKIDHLVRDISFLLLGLPSRIFLLDQKKREFSVLPGICLSGTSPEAMNSILAPFLECGSIYYRLELFSKPPHLNSFYTKGLVFQAFATVIRKYLRFYEAFVLTLTDEKSLLKLEDRCHHVFKQMRFLSELCQITDPEETEDQFPVGLKLLSYVYEWTLSSTATDNYCLLLSILKTSAMPYLNFVQKWVYHGECFDPYEEFMIRVNNDFLFCRDKHYWGKGYDLVNLGEDSSEMPLFLSEIMRDIYNCGKALNLLKLCCPDHFMCNVPATDVPKLSITYDNEALGRIQVNTGIYVSRVEEVTRRNLVSRKELLEREERARFDLIQKGRQAAQEHMEKARQEKAKVKLAIQAKKRKELSDLKIGMEKDMERKKELIETQKQEDKDYMETLADTGKQKSELELRLEEQAKLELIKQYETMTAQALLRERRAFWKIERAKLTLERNSMLKREEIELQEEYERYLAEKAKDDVTVGKNYVIEEGETGSGNVNEDSSDATADEVVVSVSDVNVAVDNLLDLTSFAVTSSTTDVSDGKNLLDMTVPEVGPGSLLDSTLPKWAQSTESKTVSEEKGLPIWAQKGIGQETVVVESSEIDEKPHDNFDEEQLVVMSEKGDATEADGNEIPKFEPSQPIRSAIEESTQVDRKSSTRSVSGRHIGQTNFSFRDMAPEPYEITVPNLRPIEDILNDTGVDTSFDICRRTSIYIKNDTIIDDEISGGKEDENDDIRSQRYKQRNVHGSHPSQTTECENFLPAREKPSKITEQSEPTLDNRVVRFKEQNVHGHAADSKIKMVDGSAASPWETEKQGQFKRNQSETQTNFENQKMKQHHVSDESESVDIENLRIRKFQQTNRQGHSTKSSQSSVQKLLYGENFGKTKDFDEADSPENGEEIQEKFTLSPHPWLDHGVEQYQDNFDEVYESPNFDMASRAYNTSITYENKDAEDTTAQKHISLPVLLKRSVVGPILAQISLMNRSLVTYFFQDLMIDRHFEALKLFMFLEDGEFGQTLGDIMFEKLVHDPLPHEVFNTVFLSSALMKALRASNLASKMSENLLFGNKYLPKMAEMNGPRALDCLELHYQIDWPVNIVITDSCMLRYNMIFCFMLQLKRVAWCLNDSWHRLKRDATVNFGSDLSQFRTLHLYRHEMQNFVRVVQSYLSNQIIHVSWKEFQQELMESVKTLDDLHDVHATYLNKAIFRCLLSKKAGSMMKVIQDILGQILKFHCQLLSAGWQRNNENKVNHPSYDQMRQTYRAFRDYSMFLFKVIRKVTARGYQPHLEELLLRLNFNAYYTHRQHLR